MTEQPVAVLVVDDDDAGRYFKAHVLRRNGYQVTEAGAGRIALEICEKSPPALVVLDTQLPDLGGPAVCRHIKRHWPQITVLQTSAALTTAHDRAVALEGGADTFLVEPIEPEELLASVKALLRMRVAEQSLRRMNEHLEELVNDRTQKLTEAKHQLELEIVERQKAEEVLRHAQKLEAIGQLTGGIAHDFNNLLAVIVGSLGMLRASIEGRRAYAPERILRLLNAAESAADRGTKVTQQLLSFARRGAFSSQVVSIGDAIAGYEGFLRRALGEATSLVINVPPELWTSRIDPIQFEAALLNLAVNARDAMPDGGTFEIDLANCEIGPAPSSAPASPMAGQYVRMRVGDNGIGMDPDVVKRAFEPFFTTKDVGRGTGLGLSQVYGFVTQFGGHIEIDSTPGRGSVFTIHLPRCEAVPMGPQPQSDQNDIPTGDETILVVEDNEGLRELAIMMIGDLGYHVVAASDGRVALTILEGGEHVDMIFSDVVMSGGINGFQLVRKARELRPGLKALMTSGFANVSEDGSMAQITMLPKPYGRGDLARGLRRTLDLTHKEG